MAKREIRKLSRTTNLLFPKRPFNRLVREIAQDINCNMKFKKNAILTIQASLLVCTCTHTHMLHLTHKHNCDQQEAAETFVTETSHKADMARNHAKRETLQKEDIMFSR